MTDCIWTLASPPMTTATHRGRWSSVSAPPCRISASMWRRTLLPGDRPCRITRRWARRRTGWCCVCPPIRIPKRRCRCTPWEPPETVYYALSILTRQVSAEKLSLRLTAEGRCLEGNKSYAPTADTRTAVLAQGSTHYSDRYACAYAQSGKLTLWYLNGRSLTERQQLLRCFGADSVCLSTGSGTLSLTAE